MGLRIQALSHNNDTPSDEGDAAESSGLGDIFSLSQVHTLVLILMESSVFFVVG